MTERPARPSVAAPSLPLAAAGPSRAPTDTPLGEVVDTLGTDGWAGQFRALAGARVECLTCRAVFAAERVGADEVTRLEGESDPADMAVVVPLRCPRCGTHGTLVLAYGPNASAEEADVLGALDRHRPREGDTTFAATPGIGSRDHRSDQRPDQRQEGRSP